MTSETELLDVGTGSGILSIVALKLGAKHAVGTDLDPCAVPAVEENKEANEIPVEAFDMMIGNIIDDKEVQDKGQHVVIYQLAPGEVVSVESENILAFTPDCNYQVRFIGCGIFSQKGLATSTLTGKGPNAYVALLCNGNPIVLSNVNSNSTLCVDPDAVICWFSQHGYCDPQIKTDLSWKNFIGQASGESYSYEWNAHQPVTVLVQPNERIGGIRVGID